MQGDLEATRSQGHAAPGCLRTLLFASPQTVCRRKIYDPGLQCVEERDLGAVQVLKDFDLTACCQSNIKSAYA